MPAIGMAGSGRAKTMTTPMISPATRLPTVTSPMSMHHMITSQTMNHGRKRWRRPEKRVLVIANILPLGGIRGLYVGGMRIAPTGFRIGAGIQTR